MRNMHHAGMLIVGRSEEVAGMNVERMGAVELVLDLPVDAEGKAEKVWAGAMRKAWHHTFADVFSLLQLDHVAGVLVGEHGQWLFEWIGDEQAHLGQTFLLAVHGDPKRSGVTGSDIRAALI